MNADAIFDAIGEIREDLIADAEIIPFRPRRRYLRNLIAACLTVFLLAIPVSAEMRTGYISNLLAPLYGNAQTELVDSVGVPIGASCTAAGYTLTAEAVIGDRYNVAVVYSLTREDGGPLPEGLQFDDWDSPFDGSSGGGYLSHTLSADGNTLKIVESWSSSDRPLFLFRRKATVEFKDLIIWDNGNAGLHQKGTWKLNFTIRYKDTTRKFSVPDVEVVSSEGNRFTVHKVEISPFGVRLKLTVPNPYYGKELLKEGASKEEIMDRGPKQFEFAVKQRDGTVVEIAGGTSASGSLEKQTMKGTFHAMLDEPIPLENIAALIFCGTEYPVTF